MKSAAPSPGAPATWRPPASRSSSSTSATLAAMGSRRRRTCVRPSARHLVDSEAYGHEQGLEEAREAIAAQQQARGASGVDVGARIHRQRRQRTDRHQPARAAAARRRGAAAQPRLPAVERRHHPQRRQPALLPLPRRERPPARSGRGRSADHPAHARAGADQPEQPDRRGVSAGAAGTHRRGRRVVTACSCCATRSTTRSCTTNAVPAAGRASPAIIPASASAACPRCIAPVAIGSAG